MSEIVSIGSLWLAIGVASVVVFVASSIVWMVLPHHRHDWKPLPDEEGLMTAMRNAGVRPGQYAFPNAGDHMEKMREPEFVAKMQAGPVGMLVLGPNGPPPMPRLLGQWFVYTVVVGIFVAYLTGRAVGPGAEFATVFRFASTTAFVAYSMALVPAAIFKNHAWGMTFKEVLDGLAYALLTGAVFGLLWPG